jgi:hypothetical protein
MPTLRDHQNFEDFFSGNKKGAVAKYKALHEEFVNLFNEILSKGRIDFKSKQKGTAVTLYLRAVKYLYTAHDLAITGHTEESRILWRNTIELILLGFLIYKEKSIFELWEECFQERTKHTSNSGRVDVELIKERKYQVKEILKRHIKTLKFSQNTQHLIRIRGEFSTYFSHENLFNIVPRIDQGDEKSEIYIGTSYQSDNDRMSKNIMTTKQILNDIKNLVDEIIVTL